MLAIYIWMCVLSQAWLGFLRQEYWKKWKWKLLSRIWLFVTPWTTQSMEFFRLEYWNGKLCPFQGIFTTQGSNPGLPHCRWILYQLSHKENPRYLSALSFPIPGHLPDPGIRLIYLGYPALTGRFFTAAPSWKSYVCIEAKVYIDKYVFLFLPL